MQIVMVKKELEDELYHHGIKGQKWGVRRYQNKDGSLTKAGEFRYAKDSGKTIRVNDDGSQTIPKGFQFNRVGKHTLDVNQSGGLYVSYGKQDAARYVKSLGPTTLGKLFGTAGEAIQHISVKSDIRMPSDSQVAKETASLLRSNKKLLDGFNDSLYSSVVTGDLTKNISQKDIEKAFSNPQSKYGQKLAYGVSSFLGDPNFANESKVVYEHFKSKGYDAIPDTHDRLSGTAKTSMIVLNHDKVEVTSATTITKDVMKASKAYVKTLEKLKVSELLK